MHYFRFKLWNRIQDNPIPWFRDPNTEDIHKLDHNPKPRHFLTIYLYPNSAQKPKTAKKKFRVQGSLVLTIPLFLEFDWENAMVKNFSVDASESNVCF